MTAENFALSLRGVARRFGNTIALDDARLDVRTGSLHALLGENGAGKTTLMRLAFGMLRPDAGTIEVDGVPRHWRSTADAIGAGVGMVHQHFMLVPSMTVAENVSLGERGLFRGFDPRVAADHVSRIGAETGLVLDPAARVSDLPVGAQQRLEIIKALLRHAKILILDEPTAVLSPAESRELYFWLRSFVARGRTVVLITHKVREALAIADEVTVLRRGRAVLSGSAAEFEESAVITAMVGASAMLEGRSTGPGWTSGTTRRDPVMSLGHVSLADARGVRRLRDVSLEVRAGEIVGVAGVEGSGQHELLRVLAGRLQPNGGTVRIPTHIGFVPEDRQRDALIPSMSLVENLALKEAGGARGIMPWQSYATRTLALVHEHEVRANSEFSLAGELSGGNQQKFVLARELDGPPEALVVENPTRGLDIRATSHVLAAIRHARMSGVAVVMYSSDLDEALSMADRMLVCFEGRVMETSNETDAVGRALAGLA